MNSFEIRCYDKSIGMYIDIQYGTMNEMLAIARQWKALGYTVMVPADKAESFKQRL